MADLSAEDRAFLARVVDDPDVWWAHVKATVPPEAAAVALAAKVARWRQSVAMRDPGYKPRASRPDKLAADSPMPMS